MKFNLSYFWSMRHQFVHYFITGVSGVVIDISSLYILERYLSIRPWVAVIMNQVLVISYIYLINKYWTFKVSRRSVAELGRFLCLALINYFIAVGFMWIFNEVLDFNYLIVRVVNIALSVFWNFLAYKYWVYAITPPRSTARY